MSAETENDLRWIQRFENLTRALAQLEAACVQETYSDLERAGLVQMFEFSFELSWKTLKDLLSFEGYTVASPRAAIRTGLSSGYLGAEDTEIFLDALSKRNLLTHTYEEKTAREAQSLIKNEYFPMLKRLHATLESKRGA